MLANVTLHNQNGFSVKNAIVTCEIYEETRVPQNRRGVTVRECFLLGELLFRTSHFT